MLWKRQIDLRQEDDLRPVRQQFQFDLTRFPKTSLVIASLGIVFVVAAGIALSAPKIQTQAELAGLGDLSFLAPWLIEGGVVVMLMLNLFQHVMGMRTLVTKLIIGWLGFITVACNVAAGLSPLLPDPEAAMVVLGLMISATPPLLVIVGTEEFTRTAILSAGDAKLGRKAVPAPSAVLAQGEEPIESGEAHLPGSEPASEVPESLASDAILEGAGAQSGLEAVLGDERLMAMDVRS